VDTPEINEHINNGLAQIGAKQRELEAYAYQLQQQQLQLDQERAQFAAMQQQMPQQYTMVNPYFGGFQQQPVMQQQVPASSSMTPEPQQAVAPQPQQAPLQQGPVTSSPTPKSDAQFLAAAMDKQTAQFNAAMETMMTTMNDFGRRLQVLEGGSVPSPSFEEVFEPTPETVEVPAPVVIDVAEESNEGDRIDQLSKRVDVLAERVERLADVVEDLVVQQRKTNSLLEEVVGLLRQQVRDDVHPDDEAEPAVVLEMPTAAPSVAGDVVTETTPTPKLKKGKSKRKKRKR